MKRLQELNEQLREDCVLDVGDNSKLSGEFRWEWIFFTQVAARMAMNIVEGYVVKTENEWCTPFALGEPKYSTKVKTLFGLFWELFIPSGERETERKGRVLSDKY